MQKKFQLYTPVIVVLMALSVLLTVVTFFFDRWLFVLLSIICVAVFFLVYLLLARANRNISGAVKELGDSIYYANLHAYVDSNMPVMTVYEGGEILWCNQSFADHVALGKEVLGEHVKKIFPDLKVNEPTGWQGANLEHGNKKYTVYVTVGKSEYKDLTVVYFIDDTVLKEDALEYHQTRPSVAVVLVDSYEEIIQDYKDLERAQIMGSVEDNIRSYFNDHHGFVVKLERDRFLVIIAERGMDKIKLDKFDLLHKIRNNPFSDKITTTLSIGVGYGAKNLSEGQELAGQALDMSLGRGGDQAAVKTVEGSYEFYGGVSSGVEKRTKVKSRIIASALAELIESSSNVIIMAHRFADLDALGAGVGMLKAVRQMKPNSFICINQEKTMVVALLEKLKTAGYGKQDFKHPDDAIKAVNNNTLLIIVDAHVPNVLESEKLYRICKKVVVIDHHRKLVNYINDAVIFYHEPYASSASEMVTELIQYFPVDPKIEKPEAEALLAGITLDTKNFIMRTGVRTFEAAAWLRRMGADTVEVRRMFASSMDNYRKKATIVAGAEIYRHCALAATGEQFEGIRVVTAQAADDLMNISGTMASFVISPYEDTINVSARSMGEINVQVVMESLGGGGHNTMAAAQFPNADVADIMVQVKGAIDKYYASLSEERLNKLNIKEISNDDMPHEGVILEGQELTKMKSLDEATVE